MIGNSAAHLVNGVIPWGIVNTATASEFAGYGAAGVRAVGGSDTGGQSGWGAATNARPAAGQVLTAPRTINSLNLIGFSVSGAHALTIGSGGLIFQNGGTMSIATAALTAGSGAAADPADLIVHMPFASSDLAKIAAPITDNPATGQKVALVKTGPGALELDAPAGMAHSYTGGTVVTGGTLRTYDPLPPGEVRVGNTARLNGSAELNLNAPEQNQVMVPGTLRVHDIPVSGTATLRLAYTGPSLPTGTRPEVRVNDLVVEPGSKLSFQGTAVNLGVVGKMDVRGAYFLSAGAGVAFRGLAADYKDDRDTVLDMVFNNTGANNSNFRFAVTDAAPTDLVVNATITGGRGQIRADGPNTRLIFKGAIKSYDDNGNSLQHIGAQNGALFYVHADARFDTAPGVYGLASNGGSFGNTLSFFGDAVSTFEFDPAFKNVRDAGTNTRSDNGSWVWRWNSPGTYVTRHSDNLPNLPAHVAGALPAGFHPGLMYTEGEGLTWRVAGNDQQYNQRFEFRSFARVQTDKNLTFTPGGLVQFGAGTGGGMGGLEKLGPGTLKIAGTLVSTIQATTAVTQGTLLFSGQAEGMYDLDVFVRPGATVGGSGDLPGDLTLAGGAILAPGETPGLGQAVGTMRVRSNDPQAAVALEMRAGAIFRAELMRSLNDKVLLTGTASIGGAELELIPLEALAAGDTFFLLDNDLTDPITGQMTAGGVTLADGATFQLAGQTWQISYTADAQAGQFSTPGGNDLAVSVAVPEPAALTAAAFSLLALRRRRTK